MKSKHGRDESRRKPSFKATIASSSQGLCDGKRKGEHKWICSPGIRVYLICQRSNRSATPSREELGTASVLPKMWPLGWLGWRAAAFDTHRVSKSMNQACAESGLSWWKYMCWAIDLACTTCHMMIWYRYMCNWGSAACDFLPYASIASKRIKSATKGTPWTCISLIASASCDMVWFNANVWLSQACKTKLANICPPRSQLHLQLLHSPAGSLIFDTSKWWPWNHLWKLHSATHHRKLLIASDHDFSGCAKTWTPQAGR